jgi:hypothetical protein
MLRLLRLPIQKQIEYILISLLMLEGRRNTKVNGKDTIFMFYTMFIGIKRQIKEKDWEYSYGQMDLNMKVCGLMESVMVRVE